MRPVSGFISGGRVLRIAEAPVVGDWRRDRAAVEGANKEAARSSAREDFGRLVQVQLEGGVAAILTPERRRRLVAGASRQGMTPFEANLVIAMVQHDVRRVAAAEVLRGAAAQRVGDGGTRSPVLLVALSVLLGVAMFALARMWLIG